MKTITSYFSNLSELQLKQFAQLETLYKTWNAQINVISRKDIDALYLRHVLHSLAIAKVIDFKPDTTILDVGTGGGFPGIPLAILFPKCHFLLIDSIQKKIKVVQEVSSALDLKNVTAKQIRANKVTGEFDFIISRAVTNMNDFVKWIRKKIKKRSNNDLKNGILYLKGGDLSKELANFPKANLFLISNFFTEPFFETKKVVYLPLKKR